MGDPDDPSVPTANVSGMEGAVKSLIRHDKGNNRRNLHLLISSLRGT